MSGKRKTSIGKKKEVKFSLVHLDEEEGEAADQGKLNRFYQDNGSYYKVCCMFKSIYSLIVTLIIFFVVQFCEEWSVFMLVFVPGISPGIL